MSEDTESRGDYYALRSPVAGHCAVARLGEGGTIGWPTLFGPAFFSDCWTFIGGRGTGGPYYHCG
ncbi:MAG: hypothetical protein ACRDRT_09625 [Pseudonocardiaceae bacterium]